MTSPELADWHSTDLKDTSADAVMAGKKLCTRCRNLLAVEDFARDKAAEDGLQRWCRGCQKLYQQDWKERKRQREERLTALATAKVNGTGLANIERDELAKGVLRLRLEEGLSRREIATSLGMTVEQVRVYLSRARRLAFDGDSREDFRHWLLEVYDEIIQRSLAKGSVEFLNQARLAAGDAARTLGLVSTGGNTVNIGPNAGANVFEQRVMEALARPIEGDVVDAQVVEGQAPALEGGKVVEAGAEAEVRAAGEAAS